MRELKSTGARNRRRTRAELVDAAVKLPEPSVEDLAGLDSAAFAAFAKNKKAVEAYRHGLDATTLLEQTGVRLTEAARMLNRAMRTNPRTGRPFGLWACIPGKQLRPIGHSRRSPFDPVAAADGHGLKNALNVFFQEHPDIKRDLDTFLRTRRLQAAAPEPCISSSRCLANFYKLCRGKQLDLMTDQWPYNTKRKGANAVRNYYRAWKAENPQVATLNEKGEDAAKERQVDIAVANNVDQPVNPLPLAYGRVEIDEHLLHASAEVTFPTQSGIDAHVEVRRLYALVLRECRTGAILAATPSYGGRYDLNDVMRLVRKALFPPKRFNLTIDSPEFRYHEGAAYPAELPTFAANCWQLLAFDADSTHLSAAQKELVRRVLRCKVAGERIGSPTARHGVEGAIGGLAKHFEVLSSGSGSHPRSPARRDPEGAARHFGIKVEHLEEILDVWARNKNAAFSPALGASPLDALEKLTLKGEVFINKLGEFAGPDKHHEFFPRFECTLRLSRGRMGALLVNLYGAKYSGPELASNKLLMSTSDLGCTLYVNDEDARFGFVIPRAYPEMRLPVAVQNRALRQFKHTLEARRLTCAFNFNLGVADKAVKPDSIRGALDYYGRKAQNKESGASVAVSRLVGAQAQETLGSASTLAMGVEWGELQDPVLDAEEAESADMEEGDVPARDEAPKKRGRNPKARPAPVDFSTYTPPQASGPSNDPLGLGF